MKIWFDTEFIEDGKTIELISIGAVREDGATLYFESADCDLAKASQWVQTNVIPHLRRVWTPRSVIASVFSEFVGAKPEFWAYYGAYDWVVLCQLYGTMMDLPKGWPMYCRDVQQLFDEQRARYGSALQLPEQTSQQHNALADAQWTKQAWEFLQ